MKKSALFGSLTNQNGNTKLIKLSRNQITEIISALLILLFLYTSVSKFFDLRGFIHDMNAQPFPNWMTPFMIWAVPITEILIAFSLLFEKTKRLGLISSLILMTLFTIYTGLVLLNVFNSVPCSCGGVIKKLTWTQHLFFNLLFVGLSLTGILLSKEKRN